MSEIKLIITNIQGSLNLRVEGMASDVHTRLAQNPPQVTPAEQIALVCMDAAVNALQGFGMGDTNNGK